EITLFFQGAEDVTGRALWNLQLTANISVAEPFRLLRHGFQHGQRPLDGDGGRIAWWRHTCRHGNKPPGGQQIECMFDLLNNRLDQPSEVSYDSSRIWNRGSVY